MIASEGHPPEVSVPASRGNPLRLASLLVPLILPLVAPVLGAQGVEEAAVLPGGLVEATLSYQQDGWDRYWEGTLERTNENLGRVTTRGVTVGGGYGVTDRLSVGASVPYVEANTSAGILQEQRGFQDLSVAARYRLVARGLGNSGTVALVLGGEAGVPVGDYHPDLLPLSIGLGARRLGVRGTVGFRARAGWFLNGSGAYTWRGSVRLDRDAYYTAGRLHLGNRVALPEVFDYTVTTGYRGRRFTLPIVLSRQHTLGGGDIRRQDMPFAANRMDFTRLGGALDYDAFGSRAGIRVGVTRVVAGRNVGRSTMLTGGLRLTLPVAGSAR